MKNITITIKENGDTFREMNISNFSKDLNYETFNILQLPIEVRNRIHKHIDYPVSLEEKLESYLKEQFSEVTENHLEEHLDEIFNRPKNKNLESGNNGEVTIEENKALKINRKGLTFYASLDVETGEHGTKVSFDGYEHCFLVWNDEMMNISLLVRNEDGEREDYLIDLDNGDWDKIADQIKGIEE